MVRLLFVASLALVAGLAPAQELRNLPPTPRDFAWQWPLTVDAEQDLVRVTLTPDIYARLWRNDVRDLVVFNGANEAVPIAPFQALRIHGDPNAVIVPAPVDVPAFRIPGSGTRNVGERVGLVVRRGPDGRLEWLDAVSEDDPQSGSEWLLDLSAVHASVRGLQVEFEPDSEPLVARVDVFGSRDLSRWTRLTASQALVILDQGGLRLERNQIEFADTTLPYLRLQRTDASAPLPIASVRVLRGRAQGKVEPALVSTELVGHAQRQPGVFGYESTGPFPVERVLVHLADRNAAASVVIESRARADLPWRERGRGPAFRLGGNKGEIESAALEIALIRDREWRVRTAPVQARAPTLVLFYRPDQFVFLTQGEGPWRLAAGSARSLRNDAPLQAVYQGLTEGQAQAWQWSEARIGRGAELAGGAALAPRPDASGSPTPWQWLLWGLLLAGAFVVVTMVLKLLRQSGA